jgi:hypothetical protein
MMSLLLFAGAAFPCVTEYSVEPMKSQWSGYTPSQSPNNFVAQTVTCNFDSLSYVELFTGAKGNGGAYTAAVFDGNTQIMTSAGDKVPDHGWIRFSKWDQNYAFTKGERYLFKFTRGANDSIQYYYQCESPCPQGIRFGPSWLDPVQVPYGLAMRTHGRMKSIDSNYWMMMPGQPRWWESAEVALRDSWITLAKSAGVGAVRLEINWRDTQRKSSLDSFDFGNIDHDLSLFSEAHCRILGLLNECAWAASSRFDSTADTMYWSTRCAPRGLFRSVDDDSNSWAHYLKRLVRHCDSVCYTLGCDSIHTWEVWNEPNDTCVNEALLKSGVPGFWRRPNRDYLSGFDGMEGLCKLYVRLCRIADSVIRAEHGHEHDLILAGSISQVDKGDTIYHIKGTDWIRKMYDIAGGSVPWNGISVHPYQTWLHEFSPDYYQENCDSVRTIMRDHGHIGPLWNTEIGWIREEGEERNARNLCKTYVTSKASETWPEGGFDHACWWTFHAVGHDLAYPLVGWQMDTLFASFYACRQMTQTLNGKRFSGRAMNEDTAGDNHVRMYEFEDPATLKRAWICWADGDMEQSIRAKLPVRTDELAAESLAYSSTTPTFTPRVTDDGWLTLNLNQRPLFIHEAALAQRPDMAVDSVRFDGSSRSVRAWVTNHGSAPTPVRSGRRAYPTWAVLKADGDFVAQAVWTKSIGINQGAEIAFELGRTELPDTALLSVTVNPSQTFVELGTDDNTGYTLKVGR